MAFENIEPDSLKNAINNCLDTLDIQTSDKLMNELSNQNMVQSSATSNLKNAFETLIEKKYREIEKNLNDYNNAAVLLQKYKEIETENKMLEIQYFNLEKQLYYNQTYTKEITPNYSGIKLPMKEQKTTYTVTLKNDYVEKQMQEIIKKMNQNKETMETLKFKISEIA